MSKMTMCEAIDPANPGDWKLLSENEWKRTWELDLGDGRLIHKTEYLNADKLLADNEWKRNENEGKKWGDGQIIGSVPLNVYYSSGYAEASRQRDMNWIRRFWADGDNAKFRTFRGKTGQI